MSYWCIFQVLISYGLVYVMPSLRSFSPYDSGLRLNMEHQLLSLGYFDSIEKSLLLKAHLWPATWSPFFSFISFLLIICRESMRMKSLIQQIFIGPPPSLYIRWGIMEEKRKICYIDTPSKSIQFFWRPGAYIYTKLKSNSRISLHNTNPQHGERCHKAWQDSKEKK